MSLKVLKMCWGGGRYNRNNKGHKTELCGNVQARRGPVLRSSHRKGLLRKNHSKADSEHIQNCQWRFVWNEMWDIIWVRFEIFIPLNVIIHCYNSIQMSKIGKSTQKVHSAELLSITHHSMDADTKDTLDCLLLCHPYQCPKMCLCL